MQSTAVPPALATLHAAVAQVADQPAPTTPDLLAAFAVVPDSRRPQGRRFPLAAVFTLAVTALLCQHLSVLAIAAWGAGQSPERLHTLGLPKGIAPHQSTLHRLFRKLDLAALSDAFLRFLAVRRRPACRRRPRVARASGIALDGKAQRGRLAFPHCGSPVHALRAVTHGTGLTLAQLPIAVHGDKAEAELTVAPALLARLDLRGRVVTGDALFCQRKLCEQILAAGGDYLLIVKDNQPTLHEDAAPAL